MNTARCWVCGSDRLVLVREGTIRGMSPDDMRITDTQYGATLPLSRCEACGFLFAAGADGAALYDLYRRLDDAEYDDTAYARRRQMRWLLERVLRERPGARSLLDVGAGIGMLVRESARMGLDALGVEPSEELAARGRKQGAKLLTGTLPLPELGDRRFDIVTLVDVLEHVTDPVGLLREAGRHLAEGGRLVVVTPDVGSVTARLMGWRWWHYRPAHVGYFSADTLARAAGAAGLRERRRLRPRWYLPLGYLARRATLCCMPARGIIVAPRPTGWLGRLVVPLDLRDSLLVLLESDASHDS